MVRLVGLPGTSQDLEADSVASRTAAIRDLRGGRAAAATGSVAEVWQPEAFNVDRGNET